MRGPSIVSGVRELIDVNRLLKFFRFDHLTAGPVQNVSKECAVLASKMDDVLLEGPEKTAGLRKLLEAKDCFVRARLEPGG